MVALVPSVKGFSSASSVDPYLLRSFAAKLEWRATRIAPRPRIVMRTLRRGSGTTDDLGNVDDGMLLTADTSSDSSKGNQRIQHQLGGSG